MPEMFGYTGWLGWWCAGFAAGGWTGTGSMDVRAIDVGTASPAPGTALTARRATSTYVKITCLRHSQVYSSDRLDLSRSTCSRSWSIKFASDSCKSNTTISEWNFDPT